MSRSEITLKLLKDFQCLASECPDDCCSYDWGISVDLDTLKKWEELEDSNYREKLLSTVFDGEINGVKQKLVGGAGKKCSLMDGNGLCTIHTDLGENYLGKTCRTYPRISKEFKSYSLKTATMSCPEIARMVFDSKDTSMFDIDSAPSGLAEHVYLINDFVDKVLNKTGYTIAARVITISRFLYSIADLSSRGELSLLVLTAMSKKISKPLKEAERDVKSKRLKIPDEVAGKFWSIIYKIISKGAIANLDERIRNHPIVAKLAATDPSNQDYKELYNNLSALRNNATPVLADILDNLGMKYLLVKFQSRGFPYDPPADNYIAAFLFGILPYCYINLCLWVLFDSEKKIMKQDVIDIIYRTERIVQHSDAIYKSIINNQQILQINEFDACFADLS